MSRFVHGDRGGMLEKAQKKQTVRVVRVPDDPDAEDWLEGLRREYVRIIRSHQVPYAENITARSDWLFYVYFCRLVSTCLPNRQARIVDWGGLYGHVTKILHRLGYGETTNYLLHESPYYPLFQQAIPI